MSFEFLQLADPQFGMFADFSQLSPAERKEAFGRLREMGALPGPDPEVPEGVTDLGPELLRFRAAIAEANRRRPAFVVVCGDLVHNIDQPAQWKALFDTAAGLDDGIPLHWIAGNHDLSLDAEEPTPDALSAYRDLIGSDYYTFSVEDTFFLALDSETLHRPNRVAGEGARQLEFVADALSSRAAREARHRVAFMHTPLFLRDPREGELTTASRENRYRLFTLFDEFGVKTVFSGHLHQNRAAQFGGVRQVASGAVGFPLQGESGYRVVKLTDDAVVDTYHPFTLD